MADFVPILSQAKSAVQYFTGDEQGARTTQNNFTKSFPVISLVRAAVEYISGDEEAAKDTLMTGAGVIDLIPVVGHVKGVAHYACGDKEGGDNAMKSASRTVGVIGGAVGGFVVAGPPGGAAGAMAGGAALDAITTVVDSAIHGELRSSGTVACIETVIRNPTDPYGYLDVAVGPLIDGIGGYEAGRMLGRRGPSKTISQRRAIVKGIFKDAETTNGNMQGKHSTSYLASKPVKHFMEEYRTEREKEKKRKIREKRKKEKKNDKKKAVR